MLLVGEDAVHFNRAFARAGLHDRCRRLSTLMDENMLLASGAGSTRGICATAAYFETLTTPESLDFGWRYTQRFGPDAPTLNSLGESCYEGVVMLAALARRAGNLDTRAMCAVADSVSYDGPRGELQMRDRHVDQRVYLAEANDVEFDVIAQSVAAWRPGEVRPRGRAGTSREMVLIGNIWCRLQVAVRTPPQPAEIARTGWEETVV